MRSVVNCDFNIFRENFKAAKFPESTWVINTPYISANCDIKKDYNVLKFSEKNIINLKVFSNLCYIDRNEDKPLCDT